MASKLKRDEIPSKQAENWRRNFNQEKEITFNLSTPVIVLQKETYKILAGENENRVRIYLGLEPDKVDGKYKLAAFAVSAFLLGSGDVYVDYETPVFKMEKQNVDYSSKTDEVVDMIKRYRLWRSGELESDDPLAAFRKYIYPNAYLLTKFELHDIFNVQNKSEAQIEFGISKTMHTMIYTDVNEQRATDDTSEVFDFGGLCPPICGEGSIYNF